MKMHIKNIKMYSGEELREYVQGRLKNVKHNRVEVNEILESFKNSNKVKAILGERRQGKSTVLLGIIEKINSYEDTILITGREGSGVTIYEIFDYIITNKIKNKYLFIDEIQFFDDYTKGVMQSLYDELISVYDFKVFITGTWSQYITVIAMKALFGRVDMFEILPITFTDDKYYYNRDSKIHCMNGGYIQDINKDISVIDAMSSIKHFLNLATGYDDMQIEAISRYLSTSMQEISYNNFRKFLEKYKYVLEEKYSLDIEYLLTFSKRDFLEIIRILSISGLYKKYLTISDNINDSWRISYVSRNILLSYYLTKSLQSTEVNNVLLQSEKLGMINEDSGDLIQPEKLGMIFEDAIRVLLTSNNISANKIRTKTGDFELDILSKDFIAEIKLSDKKRNDYYKNLMDIKNLNKFNLIDKTKILIYNGETSYNKEFKILSQNIYDFEKDLNIKSRMDPVQRKNYNEELYQAQFNLKW